MNSTADKYKKLYLDILKKIEYSVYLDMALYPNSPRTSFNLDSFYGQPPWDIPEQVSTKKTTIASIQSFRERDVANNLYAFFSKMLDIPTQEIPNHGFYLDKTLFEQNLATIEAYIDKIRIKIHASSIKSSLEEFITTGIPTTELEKDPKTISQKIAALPAFATPSFVYTSLYCCGDSEGRFSEFNTRIRHFLNTLYTSLETKEKELTPAHTSNKDTLFAPIPEYLFYAYRIPNPPEDPIEALFNQSSPTQWEDTIKSLIPSNEKISTLFLTKISDVTDEGREENTQYFNLCPYSTWTKEAKDWVNQAYKATRVIPS